MYAKVINPKTNGKKVYDNKGSSLRATNYLVKEAKAAGEEATFFGGPGSPNKSAEEVVAMLDGNVKGLRKDDAKFYSLVLSPSPEELAYMGNDPKALEKYAQNVMDDYAKNFTLKNGKELGESNLVWAAIIHQDRKNRGTDEGMQGERKEGLQTHIHVTVSARDAEQKITLNPLSTPDRFNRVQFQAKAVAQFEIQFGRMGNLDLMKPEPTRKQLIAEKAEEITIKAAANKREKKSLTEQQIAAKDARLNTQVARLNFKLDASQHLDPERVKEVAKERSYDNVFYATLGKIERNAEKGTYTHNPYDYLVTGQVSKAGELRMEATKNFSAPPGLSKAENEQELGGGTARALEQTINRLSRAIAPKSKAQDVRSEAEKEKNREHDLMPMAELKVETIPTATQRLAAYEAKANSTLIGREFLVKQHELQPERVQRDGSRALEEQAAVPTVPESPVITIPTQQPASVPLVSKGTSDSNVSPEVTLPIAPRRAVATQAEERALHPAVPAEARKLSATPVGEPAVAPSALTGIASSVPTQEREAQPPVVKAISPPPVVAAGPTQVTSPSGGLTEAHKSVASRLLLNSAVPVAGIPRVEPTAQPARSQETIQKQLPVMSLAEKLISELPDLPATTVAAVPVVVTAPVVLEVAQVAEAVWQHGIIQMEANEKRTSEERLSAVRAALLAAGATVGELVLPTPGRHAVPLLPYSFDPTTTGLEKVRQVLDDVQAAGKSKVQEQLHPWHQPTSAPEADNMQWPDREGQFDQAHVLIDDPAAGQARASRIADALRRAGARVSEIQHDEQGRLTMQVSYHTYTPSIDAINEVLDSANNSIGIEVQESQQNKDARYRGAVQVAIQQQEMSADNGKAV